MGLDFSIFKAMILIWCSDYGYFDVEKNTTVFGFFLSFFLHLHDDFHKFPTKILPTEQVNIALLMMKNQCFFSNQVSMRPTMVLARPRTKKINARAAPFKFQWSTSKTSRGERNESNWLIFIISSRVVETRIFSSFICSWTKKKQSLTKLDCISDRISFGFFFLRIFGWQKQKNIKILRLNTQSTQLIGTNANSRYLGPTKSSLEVPISDVP